MGPQPRAGLDQRMLQRLDTLQLAKGAMIGVAFSGGVDSLAVARSLSLCSRLRQFRVHLLHVDHRLRTESSADARRCEVLAEELALPITIVALSEGLADRTTGAGIEHTARLERYRALEGMCCDLGIGVLATGHHRGDQAETVLLHLFRGSGLNGVAAMSEAGSWPVESVSTGCPAPPLVWRPVLSEPRKVLADYVSTHGLTPVFDHTNADTTFRRNALRHTILPLIEAYFPGTEPALARFAATARQDNDYLSVVADDAYAGVVADDGRLAVSSFQILPVAVATRVVHRWLREQGVSEPSWERVRAVATFAIDAGDDRHIEAGDDRWVVGDRGHLRCDRQDRLVAHLLERHSMLPFNLQTGPLAFRARPCHAWNFADSMWWIDISDSTDVQSGEIKANSLQILMPESLSVSTLEVRSARRGDVWFTTGNALKETLRELEIHPLARWSAAVVAVDNRVLAVPGIGPRQINRGDIDANVVVIRWGRGTST
ncbi:MAG: tRNA lysidine(34) synthetase TilS [Thermomicrobiales bacterium]